jgi:L-arabinokinase
LSVYSIVHGPQHRPDDTRALITSLDTNSFFSDVADLVLTRAPGRLDVMGGIADYSGSLVLQLPIADATHVILQQTTEPTLHIQSAAALHSEARTFTMEMTELVTANGAAIEYSAARQIFLERNAHWAAYVAGAFLALIREKGYRFDRGARMLISSNVPEGKGVSSSAALEVATMTAIAKSYEIEVSQTEIALLCQKVENLIAGAPCGIMDQMTSSCGEQDRLLELLCQPSQFIGTLALPAELEVWGIDSGVRHSVGGSDYTTVRTAAFMGYRMIAEIAGLKVMPIGNGKVKLSDPYWNGYLANITPLEFEETYLQHLPARLKGAEFLKRYEGISDAVTHVEDSVEYPIRAATAHPIYENHRVNQFAAILKHWTGLDQATQLGNLMLGSHQSYTDCGLGSERTDLIVELVKEDNQTSLFGGRITGGGSGGTVAVLGRRGATESLTRLVEKFQRVTGYLPLVLSGSSTGAAGFDHLRLRKVKNAQV